MAPRWAKAETAARQLMMQQTRNAVLGDGLDGAKKCGFKAPPKIDTSTIVNPLGGEKLLGMFHEVAGMSPSARPKMLFRINFQVDVNL
jgi:hypothetical protein